MAGNSVRPNVDACCFHCSNVPSAQYAVHTRDQKAIPKVFRFPGPVTIRTTASLGLPMYFLPKVHGRFPDQHALTKTTQLAFDTPKIQPQGDHKTIYISVLYQEDQNRAMGRSREASSLARLSGLAAALRRDSGSSPGLK